MAFKDYLFVNDNVSPSITITARFDNFNNADNSDGRDNNNIMDLIFRRTTDAFPTAAMQQFRFNLMNFLKLGDNYTEDQLDTIATDNGWQLWLDGTQLV